MKEIKLSWTNKASDLVSVIFFKMTVPLNNGNSIIENFTYTFLDGIAVADRSSDDIVILLANYCKHYKNHNAFPKLPYLVHIIFDIPSTYGELINTPINKTMFRQNMILDILEKRSIPN